MSVPATAPTSFRESQGQIALSERQEAFFLERLPINWTELDIQSRLKTSWRVSILSSMREHIWVCSFTEDCMPSSLLATSPPHDLRMSMWQDAAHQKTA